MPDPARLEPRTIRQRHPNHRRTNHIAKRILLLLLSERHDVVHAVTVEVTHHRHLTLQREERMPDGRVVIRAVVVDPNIHGCGSDPSSRLLRKGDEIVFVVTVDVGDGRYVRISAKLADAEHGTSARAAPHETHSPGVDEQVLHRRPPEVDEIGPYRLGRAWPLVGHHVQVAVEPDQLEKEECPFAPGIEHRAGV